MAMGLRKSMTSGLASVELLKLFSAVNHIFLTNFPPVWHTVGLHSLALLWLGGDHVIILVNELSGITKCYA